ncbi:MAG: gliding motility lipoprotein GldH [Bacteroidota bacterium]
MRVTATILIALLLIQCKPIDVYERTVDIPRHAWKSDFTPDCSFHITDTNALYNLSLILRHTDAYPFNNIWLSVRIEAPDTVYTFKTEQRLGTNEQGWLGTGLNDVYEHRLPLNTELNQAGVSFRRAGNYTFRISQIMREDPLPQVLQAGIRVERKR